AYEVQPLVAPLSGRPCACYEVVVEELHGGGKHRRWRKVIHELVACDFVLRDQTGKAVVRGSGAQLLVHQDANFRSGFFNDSMPHLDAFLARHGRSSRGWIFNKRIRYNEGVLEANEPVVAYGYARWEPDPTPDPGAPAAGYREGPTRL